MKKILSLAFLLFFTSLVSTSYAGGGTTHMLIAQEAIAKLPDAELRNLLYNNIDAYLVGAYYPDSGYINGNTYGEDSHWDPFIYTFADYIKEKYSDPVTQNPRLVAFLFGCAVHRVSDEVIHWNFYTNSSQQDFNGDWDKAHTTSDPGIDLLLQVDRPSSLVHPSTWWVPLRDLLEVYHRMGKDEYTAKQIEWGNSVLLFVDYGEKLIALPAYPYLRWNMPWTAKNYYTSPTGGILMDEQVVADYETALWARLHDKSARNALAGTKMQRRLDTSWETSMMQFAREALEKGLVSVTTTYNEDGSIELQPPVVNEAGKLKTLMNEWIAKLFGSG